MWISWVMWMSWRMGRSFSSDFKRPWRFLPKEKRAAVGGFWEGTFVCLFVCLFVFCLFVFASSLACFLASLLLCFLVSSFVSYCFFLLFVSFLLPRLFVCVLGATETLYISQPGKHGRSAQLRFNFPLVHPKARTKSSVSPKLSGCSDPDCFFLGHLAYCLYHLRSEKNPINKIVNCLDHCVNLTISCKTTRASQDMATFPGLVLCLPSFRSQKR